MSDSLMHFHSETLRGRTWGTFTLSQSENAPSYERSTQKKMPQVRIFVGTFPTEQPA